jgi:hypothetical protein
VGKALKRLLTSRFGPLPARVEVRIDAARSVEAVGGSLDRALAVGSPEEQGLVG